MLRVVMRSLSLSLRLVLEFNNTNRNSQTTVSLTPAGQGSDFDLLLQFAHGFDRVEVDGCKVVVGVTGLALPLG